MAKATKTIRAYAGLGKAVHIISDNESRCGATRKAAEVTETTNKATCKNCLRKAPATKAAKASAKPAPKAKPSTPTKTAKPRKPKAPKVKSSEGTLIHGSRSTVEKHELPTGVRWARTNRIGSLVASVDLWASGDGFGDAERWGACCLTHGTTATHRTHRDAWKTLSRSADWCDGCKAGA